MVVVVVVVVVVIVFVIIVCNCNRNCNLLEFLFLGVFDTHEMLGFTSSGVARLLAPSHFHFLKIFAFYSSFIGVVKKRKKRKILDHEAIRVEEDSR